MLVKKSFATAVLLLGVIAMPKTHADSEIKIRTVYNINNAFCAIKTNDVLGMDNRYSAVAGQGMGASSTNSMLALVNGENDITIEIGALGWFSKKELNEKERSTFSSDSQCDVSLTLFNGEKRKIISQMKVSINDDGLPDINPSNADSGIKRSKVYATQIEEGHIPEKYFIKNYFPKGMFLYQFTQKVYLKGLPDWRWVRATPFTGKPEQVQALKNAYTELWRQFAAKDNAAIKSNMRELLNAWSISTGSSVDDIYDSHKFVDGFKNPGFQMIPINWNDYRIEVMNKGRLVRFVNKSDPTIYPLTYYITGANGKKKLRWFTPIFSLVDGKFIPVI